jgi:perosamine synthetase
MPIAASPALAINGGEPVRKDVLPYGHQVIDEDDIAAVVQVMRSDWITCGPVVQQFEETFAAKVGAQFAVTFTSGTAALHAAAAAAGLGPGDEAITSPMTFCATANSILFTGATPVFADVAEDTLNLDPGKVEARISPRTKAIFAVDFAGHPAELDVLATLAETRGLTLIEDAAHSLGATFHGRSVGSISHMTVFSFHPVKHITTGEGGMVTTDNPELASRLRQFRNHGITSDVRQRLAARKWQYDMASLGFNYRLPDLNCALGLSQLRRLDGNIKRRREIAGRYHSALQKAECRLPVTRSGVEHAWHLYPVQILPGSSNRNRDGVLDALRAEGIGANVHYMPVHLHSYYREHLNGRAGQYPVAESAFECLLSLPMWHGMSDADVDDSVAALLKVLHS